MKNHQNKIGNKDQFENKLVKDIPTVKANDPLLSEAGITLLIRREDLIHSYMSGNKWYKLKYNLVEARKQKQDTLLTFGGAYSNHIYATAAAGKIFNFKTVGIIRGEAHKPLNPTLSFAEKFGMTLYFLDRKTYRNKANPQVIKAFEEKFGRFYLIPEGGSNELAVIGCSEIVHKINEEFDCICCACGTGGTIAGLVAGLSGSKKVIGFSVLKGGAFLIKNVQNAVRSHSEITFNNWQINLDYHFGGYAKFSIELVNFIDQFEEKTNIPIEPIYTGKMLYGIYDLIKKDFFPSGSTIIAIHTGGLQGLKGLGEKIKKLKSER